MTTILIIMLLFGNSSGSAELISELKILKQSIKQQVEDPATRKEALGAVKAMRKTTTKFAKGRSKAVKAVLKAERPWDGDAEAVIAVMKAYHEMRDKEQQQLIDQFMILKASLNREQWEAVSPCGP